MDPRTSRSDPDTGTDAASTYDRSRTTHCSRPTLTTETTCKQPPPSLSLRKVERKRRLATGLMEGEDRINLSWKDRGWLTYSTVKLTQCLTTTLLLTYVQMEGAGVEDVVVVAAVVVVEVVVSGQRRREQGTLSRMGPRQRPGLVQSRRRSLFPAPQVVEHLARPSPS